MFTYSRYFNLFLHNFSPIGLCVFNHFYQSQIHSSLELLHHSTFQDKDQNDAKIPTENQEDDGSWEWHNSEWAMNKNSTQRDLYKVQKWLCLQLTYFSAAFQQMFSMIVWSCIPLFTTCSDNEIIFVTLFCVHEWSYHGTAYNLYICVDLWYFCIVPFFVM